MIFLIVAILAGLLGGFIAQAKGKDVALWGILCAMLPLAILILAFLSSETSAARKAVSSRPVPQPVLAADRPAPVAARENPAWKTLVEFDADIQEAVAKLLAFGQHAEERLAAAYLSVNDKGLLPSIVTKIVADEEQRAITLADAKAKRAEAMSEREKELLAERERKAEHTIHHIREMGMVYGGRRVLSAEMYYGATVADQGWAKIAYEDGRVELRAGSAWMLMTA
jgi:hypothetical protein